MLIKVKKPKGLVCGGLRSSTTSDLRGLFLRRGKKMPNTKLKEAICPVCKKRYNYPPGFEKQTCGRFDCVYKMALKKLKIKRVQQ